MLPQPACVICATNWGSTTLSPNCRSMALRIYLFYVRRVSLNRKNVSSGVLAFDRYIQNWAKIHAGGVSRRESRYENCTALPRFKLTRVKRNVSTCSYWRIKTNQPSNQSWIFLFEFGPGDIILHQRTILHYLHQKFGITARLTIAQYIDRIKQVASARVTSAWNSTGGWVMDYKTRGPILFYAGLAPATNSCAIWLIQTWLRT